MSETAAVCSHCGKVFSIPESRLRSRRNYCSFECFRLRGRLQGDKLISRFLTHIEPASDSSGCWNWTGTKFRQTPIFGSRQEGRAGSSEPARRFGYRMLVDDIPAGFVVEETCGNKNCVNPAHATIVSRSEKSKQKRPKISGENNRFARLTTDDVLKIRTFAYSGMKATEIHSHFPGISRRAIYDVMTKTTWQNGPFPAQDDASNAP